MRFMPALLLVAVAAACGGGDDGGPPPTLTPTTLAISPPTPDTIFSGGATLALSATVRDQNGDVMTGVPVTWSTSNAAVANVNANTGLVTAAAVGSVAQAATITATVTSHTAVKSTVTVRVRQKLASVDLTPNTVNLNVGGTQQLTALAKDAGGASIAGLTAFTFGSNNGGIATVSNTGLVTAGNAAGTAKIGVSLQGDGALRVDTTVVNVATFPATADVTTPGFSFSPQTVDISQNGTVTWTLGANHNVVWDTPGSPTNIATCAAGGCVESKTFPTVGAFNYHCSIHGGVGTGMNGSVVVH